MQSRTAKQSRGLASSHLSATSHNEGDNKQLCDSQSKVIATGLKDPGGRRREEGKKGGEEKLAGER